MDVEKQYAQYDAATFMLKSLALYLQGRDGEEALPVPPALVKWLGLPLARFANEFLPAHLRSQVASQVGIRESIPPESMGAIRVEEVAAHIVNHYPKKKYHAVAIGSANGALTHLCAALQIPWLPQTFLVLLRRDLPPDDLVADFHFGQQHGPRLLRANPRAALYQMLDPSNDRLMGHKMAYFRVKHLALPLAYEQFLQECLAPGGTILLAECNQTWPMAVISERHFYQAGGIGGMTQEEYLNGGERVEYLLERYNSPHQKFIVPEPSVVKPEAEWGFETQLRDSLLHFARQRDYRVKRLLFGSPEELSPPVADLHRWWYRRQNLPDDRLSLEMYTQLELYWTAKASLAPFWLVFNGENSLASAAAYIRQRDFRQIFLALFSNTVQSVGIPGVDEWVAGLSGDGRRIELVGVNANTFPIDLSSVLAYYYDVKRKAPASYPLPGPLSLEQLDEFLGQAAYDGVGWE